MATIYGNTINGYWRVYLTYTLNNSYSATQATISWSYGINWVKDVKGDDSANNYSCSNDRPTYVSCTGQTTQYKYPTATLTNSNSWAGRSVAYGSGTFKINKKTTAQSITLKALITHTPKSSSTLYRGTSTKSVTLSVSALAKYTISFNKNTSDTVGNMPSAVTKYYGISVKLPSNLPTRSGWSFSSWNTNAGGTGTKYARGATYSANASATLFAKWTVTNPPTCTTSGISLSTSSENVIRGFTDVSCEVSDLGYFNKGTLPNDRLPVTITMDIAGKQDTVTADETFVSHTFTIDGTEFTSANQGKQDVTITLTDNRGAEKVYTVGTVNIVAPTWTSEVIFNNPQFPSVDTNGYAILDSLQIMNYKTNTWDNVDKTGLELIDHGTYWGFQYTFDENHVYPPNSTSVAVQVKASYRNYRSDVSNDMTAFYTTSRNQNYSNGIYNVMFVGGVDNENFTNYTSRVWWSKINDPLYFPDTNYIEVGSNDTGVQGLTKVGDYLAVIKQSKTTDTAIFLLYPTSFEEETTYAVKQGVQGVGALSRYSFNILGDETLFLSPNGVMAIVPTQDEEHKVQNRSYFVDKRLLAETGIENAYSFVFDGKYYLSVGNGHCYVLDGNQRNSWGNDRTVLVYECYFLDNVPANCFVKYRGNLVFSTGEDVCMFGDNYTDAYMWDSGDKETTVPVSAEWSTIFDDDGSLHYYKTMQKKGNLVSILPIENETPYKQVEIDEATFNENKTMYYELVDDKYVQCTDDSEFVFTFQDVSPSEDDFNADKTAYWYIYDDEYTQCTDDSVFDPDTQYYFKNGRYYIENRSNTKVFVKKDGNEPVEIGRKFGLSSDIPSELFINKKFKKYKRLQFIIRNDADEDFGIDEIVKNYTLQNYAKK